MPLVRDSLVIAGASSLLGAELKSRLEESRFAGWDFSLLDEETAAGLLTEAAGEPAIIQPVEEGSFARAKFVFFTGSEAFAERNLPAARESGATVIDLSGAALSIKDAQVWLAIDGGGHGTGKNKTLFAIPSAPGLATAKLLDTLGRVGLCRLALVFFRPVSEANRPGIEELEAQTTQLLSFQSIGQAVFDTQVAFNVLDDYGVASRENLRSVRARIRREAQAAARELNLVQPSIQVLHAPVFYGYTFSAIAEFNSKQSPQLSTDALIALCRKTGFTLDAEDSSPLGNLSAAGDAAIHLALPEDDSAKPDTWWFWGAADNIRLPAITAVKLAEKHLE